MSLDYQIFIPARGGSKRFPGKHLQLLADIPLITHSINYALRSLPPDRIWVNSDDDSILREAETLGVQTIKRPDEYSGDLVPTAEVSEFQLRHFEAVGVPCDAMILLQATNPLRPEGLIEKAISIFEKSQRQSLATFSPLNRKFGVIKNEFYQPINYKLGQRMQDKETEYYENGLLYITRKDSIRKKVILSEDLYPLVVEDEMCNVDIDEPHDMFYAEFLCKMLTGERTA